MALKDHEDNSAVKFFQRKSNITFSSAMVP